MEFKKIENHVSGRRVLHHVLLEKTWDILEENGIKDSDFRGKALIVLEAIREYFNESEQFPPADYVTEETNIPWPSEVAIHAALKRFKDWKLTRELGPIVDKMQTHLAEQRPRKALDEIAKIAVIQDKITNNTSLNMGAVDRHETFISTEPDESIGILPPFPTWADNIVSFAPSTLNVLLGLSSAGKSWLSAVAASHAAYAQGAKVLLITKENTKESMEGRLDALYHRLDFKDLRTKVMDSRMVKNWGESAKRMAEENGDIWIFDSSDIRTVSDVQQKVVAKKPDFVVIDGAYKLAGTEWHESSELIQKLCDYSGVGPAPWFVTSQLKLEANGQKGGREKGFEAVGNKAWYRDPATVLTVTQTPELQMLGSVIRCDCVKDREGGDKTNVKKHFYLTIDFNFTQVSEYDLNDYEDEEAMSLTQ